MSWLNSNTFKANFSSWRTTQIEPPLSADPTACYDSFREHWQQAYKIIQKSQDKPNHDDVVGVISNLEQIVKLLQCELTKRDAGKSLLLASTATSSTPCLEYLLSENLLDKLYEWGLKTGRYCNAVRLGQMKLYGELVTRSSHQLLVHEPFLRPLLKFLMSCQSECFSEEIEIKLVTLLYRLCSSLMQNVELLDLFFCTTSSSKTKFIIFPLLLPYVHREGTIGLQARDTLLLCMSLSKRNLNMAVYIAEHSNVCPILATGLSGLFSVLPTHIDVEMEDWHRLTREDVRDISELSLFMSSLEFCNGVAQVAHPLIKKQLLDFLYQGFLVPVLGPAILQVGAQEQVAAIAYLDVILRSVTEPGLLPALVRFLLEENYNGTNLLDVLIYRIESPYRLSLVALALFETLVNLNCEDIMLELVFRHLRPCSHVMFSQRNLILETDMYCLNTDKLLSLIPKCCRSDLASTPIDGRKHNDGSPSTNGSLDNCLPTNWTHYGDRINESLYGNYHAYLCDAKQKILWCKKGCQTWSSSYDYASKDDRRDPLDQCSTFTDETFDDQTISDSLQSIGESSGYESLKCKLEDTVSDRPVWKQSNVIKPQCSFNKDDIQNVDNMSSSVGLFLDTLLRKLNNMLSNNFYINLHLTGLISRLTIYPHMLLQSYLLNNQLVLQPNVPSVFQIVGSLKQKIDEYMSKISNAEILMEQARAWLLNREGILLYSLRKTNDTLPSSTNTEIVKKEMYRPSITDSISSIFRKTNLGSSFLRTGSKRFNRNETENTEVVYSASHDSPAVVLLNKLDNVALCSVLLEEWLKELAAISQEHTIAQITEFILKT